MSTEPQESFFTLEVPMPKFAVTQKQGIDTFYFGRCSPSFYGFSINPDSAIVFSTEEQGISFIENNGLLDCSVELMKEKVDA